jgi:hypothetical protein
MNMDDVCAYLVIQLQVGSPTQNCWERTDNLLVLSHISVDARTHDSLSLDPGITFRLYIVVSKPGR